MLAWTRTLLPWRNGYNVADWLRMLGLGQYGPAFNDNDICADLIPSLTAQDLKELGVNSVGHRRRLLEAIAKLRAERVSADDPLRQQLPPAIIPDSADLASKPTAERRQLSVMFCDLIGSTALSSRVDPEVLGKMIRSYQSRVATAVDRFGGFIASYVGDGVLIYFGWPEAREADAERAVRAGLAVAAAVRETPVRGERLETRIGIATGIAVVGEEIGSGDSLRKWKVRPRHAEADYWPIDDPDVVHDALECAFVHYFHKAVPRGFRIA